MQCNPHAFMGGGGGCVLKICPIVRILDFSDEKFPRGLCLRRIVSHILNMVSECDMVHCAGYKPFHAKKIFGTRVRAYAKSHSKGLTQRQKLL